VSVTAALTSTLNVPAQPGARGPQLAAPKELGDARAPAGSRRGRVEIGGFDREPSPEAARRSGRNLVGASKRSSDLYAGPGSF
jgi:hypothetical protein